MNVSGDGPLKLRKDVGAGQFFTVAFGAMVGVGWIVGDWLNLAGPLGAVLAFLGGAILIALVGLCYAELCALLPVSGGEAAYAYEIFGLRAAYVVGWTLTLVDIAAISFMCIAFAWILEFLIPGMQGPVLYSFRGSTVHLISLGVALGGVFVLTCLNYRGVRSATTLQDVLTYVKLAVSVIFIAAGIFFGHVANLLPLFRRDSAGISWRGIVGVLVTTLWFYGGFNNVAQIIEEKSSATSLRAVGRIILLSIAVALVFYCLLIVSVSMAARWQDLISWDLPSAAAFRKGLHSEILARAVLIAGLCGTFTAANSCFIAASRLLFALSRGGVIGRKLCSVHPRFGSPVGSIVFVGAVASCGVFLGRTGILPIVNVGATCLALAYGVTCLGVIRLRQTRPLQPRPYRVPGGAFTAGLAALCALLMLLISLYQPYLDVKGSFPLEWMILLVWALLGICFWKLARKTRDQMGEAERHRLMFAVSTNQPTTSTSRADD